MKNTRIYVSNEFLSKDAIEAIFHSHGDSIDSEMTDRIHEVLGGREVVAVGGTIIFSENTPGRTITIRCSGSTRSWRKTTPSI